MMNIKTAYSLFLDILLLYMIKTKTNSVQTPAVALSMYGFELFKSKFFITFDEVTVASD